MENLQHALQRAAFGLEDPGTLARAQRSRERVLGPAVIEVQDLEKMFRIPTRGADSATRRALQRRQFRVLRALRGVSFVVRRGEFFGVVGRNGSGKSTLLKVLASIYRADGGRIRMAGRLAPFIELGVGFNLELTARENVTLNGVMMGLGRREAARRLDGALEFAGLGEFVDLKLKNYSSGMLVRLAFAVMVEADADIMLIDEVLAVGDASFAQRCMDVFEAKRAAGKTLVLVTHDMATVQSFCDRAMLLHDGEQVYTGDPEEAVLRYFRLNFGNSRGAQDSGVDVRVVDVWLEDEAGRRVENVEQGRPMAFNLVVEAEREVLGPTFGFELLNVEGVPVFGFGGTLDDREQHDRIAAGQQVRVTATIENRLVPGRYSVNCSVSRNHAAGDLALHDLRLLDFLVKGTRPDPGMVSVETDLVATVEDRA
jgi:ABC-2 type transport system ATP-binding protein